MDPVTKYLQQKGGKITTAYFGQSKFEIGKCWTTDEWELIYRVENNELIICKFSSNKKGMSLSSAMTKLLEQLKTLRRSTPQIRRFRGLILTESGSAITRKSCSVLKSFMLKHGAKEEIINGETWIVG